MGALPLVFVTSRVEKAREAERMGFPVEQLDLDLPEPQALDPSEIVEAKARAAYRALSRPVLVEDSGLAFRAWGGFPGALVKWVEKSAGVPALARMLDGFPDRAATAICAIAYCDGAEVVTARGETEGSTRSRAGRKRVRLTFSSSRREASARSRRCRRPRRTRCRTAAAPGRRSPRRWRFLFEPVERLNG
jgi:non-canonical purine NTP pyrophosphatase (RdgB/HAM1 family)